MAHVTFIHGIANKPPMVDLLSIWQRALADAAVPLSLSDHAVTSSMVYWADLLYPSPVTDLTAYENALESTPEGIDGGGDAEIPVATTPEEATFLEGMRRELTSKTDAELADPTQPAVPPLPQGNLERIPLPWLLKRRFMACFLRDVHHYLFDIEFAPEGRTPVRIQKTIRDRFLQALSHDNASRPHVVVSHSMGTVIAYDCLKRLDACTEVDALITIGSPLGIDEVQDKLQPGWTRRDGYPASRVLESWTNVFDRLDPVCGFDPLLANDYERGGAEAVQDLRVQNDGAWRHSATKYLRQPVFCDALRRALSL